MAPIEEAFQKLIYRRLCGRYETKEKKGKINKQENIRFHPIWNDYYPKSYLFS